MQAAVQDFDVLVINCVVLGELWAGIRRSPHPEMELARVESTLRGLKVISIIDDTAVIYGDIRGELEARGRRIPTDDIWIAATCLQFDLPLISRDAHFDRIPQLTRIAY